jgi:hypothetical protein
MEDERVRASTLERLGEKGLPSFLFGSKHTSLLMFLCQMCPNMQLMLWRELVDMFLPTGTEDERKKTLRLMKRGCNSYDIM